MQKLKEKVEQEISIPRRLEDGCESTIKITTNNFDCNALCDLGASLSIMPKALHDVFGLKSMSECSLSLHLAGSTIKKPLGRVDDVPIIANKNYVPVNFIMMGIGCNHACLIILGSPFLRTIGAVTDRRREHKVSIPCAEGNGTLSKGKKSNCLLNLL